jgi:hypothetical protein
MSKQLNKIRAEMLGKEFKLFTELSETAGRMKAEHLKSLQAIRTIETVLKKAAQGCAAGKNLDKIGEDLLKLPLQYGLIAQASFSEAELLATLTKTITDFVLEKEQMPVIPENKLAGYA